LRGASAFEKLLAEQRDDDLRVFVVWEPVLPTDWLAPSTATLKRIADRRASQYWDKERLVSRLLGEQDDSTIMWDYVAVYEPGKLWDQEPPESAYASAPVLDVIDGTREAIRRLLQVKGKEPAVKSPQEK
jgi:hypothetical protein